MALAIGIDLGTTNSVAAVATASGVEFALGAQGERIHPSVVSYLPDGGVITGREARPRRAIDPENTIYSAKRLIGQNVRAPLAQLALTSVPYRVLEGPNQQPIIVAAGLRLSVPEVSAEVLHYLRTAAERQFGDAVDQAVITVPANFSDAQRQATKEAGRLAGLEVLRLINEPTAAALAYGFGRGGDGYVAVFDFGGGTFDISVMRIRGEVYEVLATDGDFFLGGDDIDRAVAELLASEMSRSVGVDPRPFPEIMTPLTMVAEEIKCRLSTDAFAEGTINNLPLDGGERFASLPFHVSRQQFESLITGYVDRTIEVCQQVMVASGLDYKQISEVVCVGGTTRIPLVRRRLAELFGRLPAIRINPDEVVAQGAAIQAGSLSGRLSAGTGMAVVSAPGRAAGAGGAGGAASGLGVDAHGVDRPLLLDVTPATLGIATAGRYVDVLLEKNAPIPIERTKVFTTAHHDQERVAIECCRGEAKRYDDNEPLGTLVLDGLPPRPRGDVKIEVTFCVDADGILHVRARDAATGDEQRATLNVLGAPVAREVDADRPDGASDAVLASRDDPDPTHVD